MRNDIESIFRRYRSGSGWSDLSILWHLSRPFLGSLLGAMLCSLVLSGINGFLAWVIKPVIDSVVIERSKEYLVIAPVGAVLLFGLRGGFTYANNFLMGAIGAKIVRNMRHWLYEKLLRLPYGFHVRTSSGTLVSKTLNDVEVLQNTVGHTIKDFFVEGATLVVLMSIAIYRRWDLALLAFTVIPLIILSIGKLGSRMKRISSSARLLISNVTTILQESLQGFKIIRAFTMEGLMMERFRDALFEYYRAVMRGIRVNELSNLLAEILGGVGVAVIGYYSLSLLYDGSMTIGDALSFIAAILLVYTPLRRLSRVHNNFQNARAVLERVREIGVEEPEPQGGKPITPRGNIVLDRVSFQYPGNTDYALQDISLDIRAGEIIALVGYSGAGKSTLVDLVAAFWSPTEGAIRYEGESVRDLLLASVRRQMGIVTQDIILFDDTVKENIRFGQPEASDEEVIEAAKAAFAHDFIIEFPQGYDTSIGEKGVRLSGGQKQRITIARAILRNPSILILDEATSSLDTESEHQVQKALEVLMRGRTTIVIAHRLSTVKKATRIVVMSEGRILQQGTHDELLARGGLYQELHAKQFALEPDA